MPASLRPGAKVVSAGSCFAANMVPYLESRGFEYVREEYARPLYGRIAAENLSYAKFSAGYGNIYTARQLLQLLRRCTGQWTPVEDRWAEKDKVIDPFRPGLRYYARSHREFDLLTSQHLHAVRRAFEAADVFVFTLGLTEAWISKLDGAVFPACPGTVAGTFDPARHEFANFTVSEVRADLSAAIAELRRLNPRVDVILTVSPVPLVATADGGHVLLATTYSKSVLRVAADEVVRSTERVSYFPAYEIVTGPQAPQEFLLEDRRSVSKAAVDTVMAAFFAHTGTAAPMSRTAASETEAAIHALSKRIVEFECEEAFADTSLKRSVPVVANQLQIRSTPAPSPAQNLLSHTLAFCDDCLNRQDFAAAWQALCRAVSLAPNCADVLSHRGRLALHLKDAVTARRDFTEALKIAPGSSAAWSGLARCHWHEGEPAEAEAAADRALGIDPTDEEASQLKAELQAAARNAQLHRVSSMDPRVTSAECEGLVPNAGGAPAPGFADRQSAQTNPFPV